MAGSVQTQAQAARAPAGGSGVGLDLLPWPKVDFAKFGAIEAKPLSRAQTGLGPIRRTPVRLELKCTSQSVAKKVAIYAGAKNSGAPWGP